MLFVRLDLCPRICHQYCTYFYSQTQTKNFIDYFRKW